MVNNPNFVPTRIRKGNTVHGVMNVVAAIGLFVKLKDNGAGNNAKQELELADNSQGWSLTRAVVERTEDQKLVSDVLNDEKHFVSPFQKGESECSARKLYAGEYEGDEYLDSSITDSLASGVNLKFAAGKLALADDAADVVVATLSRQLKPNTVGNVRIEVDFIV